MTYGVTYPRLFRYARGRIKATVGVMRAQVSVGARSLSHKRSVQTPTAEVVRFLRENLGVTLTAVLASVDPRTVARWIAGEVVPREEAEKKLRSAYQIFDLLAQQEASATVRAWFMGMNEQLADLSPAEAIADGNSRDVLIAARAFISYG